MQESNIKEIEKKWLEYWDGEGIYRFNSNSGKRIFSIDTPPPTLSGKMHMGHAFSYSQEDFIARYKRMSGFEVFYPFGTDDNGLPTERLIEKLKNVKSKLMPRHEFVELCLRTLEEVTPGFVHDWKSLGISCDYGIYYSTIGENSRRISQKSFLELYEKGLIYKEDFPTIYCPECQTPIAQAELEDKQKSTFFSTLRFKVGREDLPIATTRPELLGACVAVFVNPQDKRYKEFVRKKARVPLFEHEVPIMADESANVEKGTGVLMVCSYGDKYDVDAIKRHKLEPRVIFNNNGTLKIEPYEGLSIKKAREKILEDLKVKKLIIEQKEIEHSVNVHDKCGTEIEFLPVEQWFVKILDKKSELIKQGKKINWMPKHMFKRYENWIKGLEWDWSISRDRYFGVPIPIWSCKKCKEIILADESELPVDPINVKKFCKKCKKEAEPERKVLDTWATSSLTPQITASLVGNRVRIPFSLRPQAHDIIRTWAFYTIVKSYLHENEVPWNNIAISGFLTLQGEKMSKSKGNVVAPQRIINSYGADSLRYLSASSKLGEDRDFIEADVVAGKKFVTKILNAANFVFMNLEYQEKMPAKLVETDRLFLTRLNNLIADVTEAFENYDYARAKIETDNFFWKVFADNYLEIVKGRVYNGNEEEKASAFYALYQGLLVILKLIAPITPFVAEEIYQKHFRKYEEGNSIHLEKWPKKIGVRELRHDEKVWDKFIEIIAKVRQAKSESKKAMNSSVFLAITREEMKELKDVLADLKSVTNAKEIKEGKFDVRVS
ncbi:valine--tRNA ligase [Candidatus Pacearchaeota archaeon]|nr:valine--tRNA ligase [Candidatus Pacearchaeota archaeon]